MENQNNPDIGKSYVEEFLDRVKPIDAVDYLRVNAEDMIQGKSSEWFQGFCQELEVLLKMQKVVGEYIEHLETKNQK